MNVAIPPARPYQTEAVKAAWQDFKARRAVLVDLPTGTGKTMVFIMMARAFVKRGMRVLILAHMNDLVDQPYQRMLKYGIPVALEKGRSHVGKTRGFADTPIVVSSVQTMHRDSRLALFDKRGFDLLVVDEAHHAHGDTMMYSKIFAYFESAKILGVTATIDGAPDSIHDVFEKTSYKYEYHQAVSDGWLAPVEQRIVRVAGLDYDRLRVRGSEFVKSQMNELFGEVGLLHAMVRPTVELADDRQCICFCASIRHAEATAELFRKLGRTAAAVSGLPKKKKERKEGIEAFKNGKVQFLVNVGIATEGFDHPPTAVVSVMVPILKRSRYAQCVGRGTRVLDGVLDGLGDAAPEVRRLAIARSRKPFMEVLDFVGNCRHELAMAIDLTDGHRLTDEERRKAKEKLAEGAHSAEEAIERARRELLEAARAAELVDRIPYQVISSGTFAGGGKLISGRAMMQLFCIPGSNGQVADVDSFEMEPVVAFLLRNGIDCSSYGMSKNDILSLRERIVARSRMGLATPKQIRMMVRSFNMTAEEAMTTSFEEARLKIANLANNNWKRNTVEDQPSDFDKEFT